jgi:hypothetical protein
MSCGCCDQPPGEVYIVFNATSGGVTPISIEETIFSHASISAAYADGVDAGNAAVAALGWPEYWLFSKLTPSSPSLPLVLSSSQVIVAGIEGSDDGWEVDAFYSRSRILFAVYSATCYCKVFWTIETCLITAPEGTVEGDEGWSLEITATDDFSYEFTDLAQVPPDENYPGDGLYAVDVLDGRTDPIEVAADWALASDFTLDADLEPLGDRIYRTVIKRLAKVSYTFVEGYTPPDDGSANGYPVI